MSNNITVEQCTKALTSKAVMVENIVSIVVPVVLATASYTVITPLLHDNEVVDNCSQKKQLKKSILSFQILATISSFIALFLTLGTAVYTRHMRNKPVSVFVGNMKTFKLGAVVIKTGILLAVLSSASVALGTYRTCVHESNSVDSVTNQFNSDLKDLTVLQRKTQSQAALINKMTTKYGQAALDALQNS
jgi:hypothetical protein